MNDDALHCDKCGLCCQHLELFGKLYTKLNDGSGACRYFDKETNLCKIYTHRPLICRVKEGYEFYFKGMPYKEYIKATKYSCEILKKNYTD